MTLTAPADPTHDAKAGFCRWCRNGQHELCASPAGRCGCPYKEHPSRPAGSPLDDVRERARASAPPRPKRADPPATTPPPAAKLVEPVWALVRAEPPAPPPKPRKLTVVEHARPFVEQLMAEGDHEWHRFAIFPSSMGASQTVGRLRKAYREMEFQSVRVADIGQSAAYGRWTGKAKRGQL